MFVYRFLLLLFFACQILSASQLQECAASDVIYNHEHQSAANRSAYQHWAAQSNNRFSGVHPVLSALCCAGDTQWAGVLAHWRDRMRRTASSYKRLFEHRLLYTRLIQNQHYTDQNKLYTLLDHERLLSVFREFSSTVFAHQYGSYELSMQQQRQIAKLFPPDEQPSAIIAGHTSEDRWYALARIDHPSRTYYVHCSSIHGVLQRSPISFSYTRDTTLSIYGTSWGGVITTFYNQQSNHLQLTVYAEHDTSGLLVNRVSHSFNLRTPDDYTDDDLRSDSTDTLTPCVNNHSDSNSNTSAHTHCASLQ